MKTTILLAINPQKLRSSRVNEFWVTSCVRKTSTIEKQLCNTQFITLNPTKEANKCLPWIMLFTTYNAQGELSEVQATVCERGLARERTRFPADCILLRPVRCFWEIWGKVNFLWKQTKDQIRRRKKRRFVIISGAKETSLKPLRKPQPTKIFCILEFYHLRFVTLSTYIHIFNRFFEFSQMQKCQAFF